MTETDKQFLEDFRIHYDIMMRSQSLRNVSHTIKTTILNIIRNNWQPQYYADLGCPQCVWDMIVLCYKLYDKK